MSVEAATASMANTTLNEPSATAEGASVGAGGDKPINASQNDAVLASAAEGRRLYIGNLAYATTEGELKEFFKDYLVETTSIPTNPRTTRPVGYAFVDVSTASEAERAIQELNGKSILDRKVSVQLARKPEPAAEGATSEGKEGEARRRPSQRGRGRGRARGGRAARSGRGGKTGADGEVDGEAPPTNVPGQVLPLTDVTNETATAEKGADGETKAPRKQRGPPEDGIPSKTKIMVANLPYDLSEDKLREIFAEYNPTGVKIALRPIPKFMVRKLAARGEARKGRGFGFVTLPTEEVQQKACTDMNGKEIEGREIAVKVAIDTPGKEDGEPEAEEQANGTAEPVAA